MIYRVLGGWDDLVDHSDQADVEDPEEDLTCARPVEFEVLDQAWDGPVDQVAAVCQEVEVNSSDRCVHHCTPRLRIVVLPIALGCWQDPNSVQLIWLPEGYDGIVRR